MSAITGPAKLQMRAWLLQHQTAFAGQATTTSALSSGLPEGCESRMRRCLLFVYVGSLAHTVADVVEGNLAPTTTLSVTIGSASAFLLIIGFAYTTLVARSSPCHPCSVAFGHDEGREEGGWGERGVALKQGQLGTTMGERHEDVDQQVTVLMSTPLPGSSGC